MDISVLKRGEFQLIERCFLFNGTDRVFLSRALGDVRCRFVEVRKGDVVFDVFDYRNTLGFILAGRIKVTKPSSSRYSMTTLEKGSLFGSADLYDEDVEVVTVLKAAANCRLVFFPRGLFETLLGEDNTLSLNYIRFLTGRVRFLNEKIYTLVAENTLASLHHYLAANAEPDGSRLLVRLDGSLSALAERLNIGRASLYRALDALEREGVIARNGREITIVDPEKLAAMHQEELVRESAD